MIGALAVLACVLCGCIDYEVETSVSTLHAPQFVLGKRTVARNYPYYLLILASIPIIYA
jgi:hypothetical protein